MDLAVAVGAGHGSPILIVVGIHRSNTGDRVAANLAMALDAECIDIGHVQQSGVLRAVRRMARGTALDLYRRMFESKWTACIQVALGADCILIGSGAQLIVAECAVGIVAVRAFHQPFIHTVMEGLRKGRFYIGMAAIAKLRLFGLQQVGIALSRVNTVTIEAADVRQTMR